MNISKTFQKAALSSGKIFSVGFISAMVGLVKISVFAYYFGVGRGMEAFFAATVLYNLSNKLLQSGALSSVFVPIFLESKLKNDNKDAWSLMINLFNAGILIGLGLCAILVLLAPWIVGILVPGFDEASRIIAVNLFRLMLPSISFSIVLSISVAILNASKKFVLPEIFGLLGGLINLGLIVIFVPIINIYALAVGALVSNIVQLFCLIVVFYKMGYRHRWLLNLKDPLILNTFKNIRPYFFYMVIMEIRSFFTVTVISFLPAGSYALYSYASELIYKLSNLLNKPLKTVAFTYIAEENVRARYIEAGKKLSKALKMIMLVTLVPISVILLTNRQIVEVLVGHGKFDKTALVPLAYALSIFAIGILFNGIYELFAVTLVSLKRNVAINIAAGVLQVISLMLLIGFSKQWGLLGAVWASPFTTLIGISILGGILVQGKFPLFKGLKDMGFLKIILSVAISYSISLIFSSLFLNNFLPIVKIGIVYFSFSVICLGVCYLLRLDELKSLVQVFVSKS